MEQREPSAENIYAVMHMEMSDTENESMERVVGVMVGGRAAGGIHILSAYPYFIEALIMLSDGQDGDLIRPLSHLSFVW